MNLDFIIQCYKDYFLSRNKKFVLPVLQTEKERNTEGRGYFAYNQLFSELNTNGKNYLFSETIWENRKMLFKPRKQDKIELWKIYFKLNDTQFLYEFNWHLNFYRKDQISDLQTNPENKASRKANIAKLEYCGIYKNWCSVVLKYVDFENALKVKTKSNSYKTIWQLTDRNSVFNNHLQFIFQYGKNIEYLSKLKYDTSWSKDLGRINKKIKEKIGINSNPIEWDRINNRFIFHCEIEFKEGQNYKGINVSNTDYFDDGRNNF